MKKIMLMLIVAGFATGTAIAKPSMDDTVTLDNGTVKMVVNVHGGALSSFTLSGKKLNPFSWKSWDRKGTGSRKEGLFLCFDRFGWPSEEEQAQGIPFHGESHQTRWQVLEQKTSENGEQILRMQCDLPIAKMSVIREYHLYPNSSVCRISDRFINNNDFKKTYSILLHPSLGPPFLDDDVLVDCNATKGFVNSKKIEEVPGPIQEWPEIKHKSNRINLRHMTDGKGMVFNAICTPGTTHGWGCVSNPDKELLVGHLWNVADYPWTRVWRAWKNDEPTALGVEFGTSPLANPFEEIKQVGDILGHPTLSTLPPGGEKKATFYLFLSRIPDDFAGVKNVTLEEGQLKLDERGKADRAITLGFSTDN